MFENRTLTQKIRLAVSSLREGRPVLLLDNTARENEGDLVLAAEKVTPENLNFLIQNSSGVICVPMTRQRLKELNIPMMCSENTNNFHTAFTVSIEAKTGITTGVSAKDRARTIQIAAGENSKPEDLARPGHIFPLLARDNGVFDRMGHTEGSVDLMAISGLKPIAVLGELMNDDGSMAQGNQRHEFAQAHGVPVLSVDEILAHRVLTEEIFKTPLAAEHGYKGRPIWSQTFKPIFLNDVIRIFSHRPLEQFKDASVKARVEIIESDVEKGFFKACFSSNGATDPLSKGLSELVSGRLDILVHIPISEFRDPHLGSLAHLAQHNPTLRDGLIAKILHMFCRNGALTASSLKFAQEAQALFGLPINN